MSDFAIAVRDLTVAYNGHAAVGQLSGAFHKGALAAIVGPNGAGKSTLLKALVGAIPIAGGTIAYQPGLTPRHIGYLPQSSAIDRRFPVSVGDIVRLGAWLRVGAFAGISEPLENEAQAALAAVGLDGFAHRGIGTLSIGQFQRVLFARLILQNAQVILLDEPFAAVDARTTADLIAIVRRWHDEGRTVLAALHDFEQVRSHFPETLLLARQPVFWGPTSEAMNAANLERARAISERWDVAALDRTETAHQ